MRGLFLQQPFEFRLDVKGDDFVQGQPVECVLRVKNHASEPQTIGSPKLLLTLANLKKIKARDATAFEVLSGVELERGIEVAANGEYVFEHTFPLERNCPITDKTQSPYLLYGNSEQLSELGQLLLTVNLHPHLKAIFDTCTTVFSFIPKGESSKNGWTSVKLKPPESRRLSFVEELNLSARFEDEALAVKYLFSVKKFDTAMTTINVKKGKTEVQQSWPVSEYLFGGGFVQQQYVEKMIDAALAEVSSGL
jgi:hypothetical protein